MSNESQRTNRKWSGADKLRIVLGAMQPGVEVSDFSRGEGVNSVLFYKWKKQLLGSANRVFEDRGAKSSAQEQRLEAELQRFKNVIAEITAGSRERVQTSVSSFFTEK
jgi:transposase-like protein